MTYKLNPEVRKIASPVVLMIDGVPQEYPNGEAVSEMSFDKDYLIASLSANDGRVVLKLEENTLINDVSWNDGKPASFFD